MGRFVLRVGIAGIAILDMLLLISETVVCILEDLILCRLIHINYRVCGYLEEASSCVMRVGLGQRVIRSWKTGIATLPEVLLSSMTAIITFHQSWATSSAVQVNR